MNDRMEYHVDLLSNDGATICGSTTFLASTNVEAMQKAKQMGCILDAQCGRCVAPNQP